MSKKKTKRMERKMETKMSSIGAGEEKTRKRVGGKLQRMVAGNVY